MRGMRFAGYTGFALSLALGGCAGPSLFPPEVMRDVDPLFSFEAWRDAGPSNPAGPSGSGHRVQFGGRIVQAGPDEDGKGILIIAEQLPIVKHPVYGPAESGKRTGQYEFALLYPGPLKPEVLRRGNKFIVVGKTEGRIHVMVEGAPKTEPYLVADCLHVWETGPGSIAGFQEDAGAGYSSLPQETHCAPAKPAK